MELLHSLKPGEMTTFMRRYSLLVLLLLPTALFQQARCQIGGRQNGKDVELHTFSDHVVLDNGIVILTLSKPQGAVIGIQYGGIENLMDDKREPANIGYWDLNWAELGAEVKADTIEGTEFKVVKATPDQVEVSFVRNWDTSLGTAQIPMNIDKRYILLRGSSGFYAYAIYERLEGFPACELVQTRMVFRLNPDKFTYMTISDNKSRIMPTEEDREPGRSQESAYPEAVILTHPTDPELKGQVDDKYQYSMDHKDDEVHGWVSLDPMVGFWITFPSQEFRSGGPTKQELTIHAGPICLVMFHSTHYIGDINYCKFGNGEPWRKVLGPFYVYLNSLDKKGDPNLLWKDAKEQKLLQERSWPYSFVNSPYFLKNNERSSVCGRLLVQDRFISSNSFPANGAYIGLVAPGDKGSWQTQSKGYQFWETTYQNGSFCIPNIIPGDYNIYGWVPGVFGDYKHEKVLSISPGSTVNLGNLIYNPLRNGPTIWEIGIPDRSAMEFFIPDPNPRYVNKLFLSIEKYRQYGLWDRYTDLYPQSDLVYTVGVDNYKKDWFFAHVTRRNIDETYKPAIWQIKFNLDSVSLQRAYNLLIAIAASKDSTLEVRFNNPNVSPPHFEIQLTGQDNAIARHGIHGFYQSLNVIVSHSWLQKGENTIFLRQKENARFNGILYDYIRFEGP